MNFFLCKDPNEMFFMVMDERRYNLTLLRKSCFKWLHQKLKFDWPSFAVHSVIFYFMFNVKFSVQFKCKLYCNFIV